VKRIKTLACPASVLFTLPADKSISTIRLVGLPVLLFYPIATVIIGRILLEAYERKHIVEALRESQTNLIHSNQELNTAMEELTATEEELRTQLMNYKQAMRELYKVNFCSTVHWTMHPYRLCCARMMDRF